LPTVNRTFLTNVPGRTATARERCSLTEVRFGTTASEKQQTSALRRRGLAPIS